MIGHTLHNKHLLNNVHNYRQAYFDNLKKELEARQSKSKNNLFRKHILDHQVKTNYRNEIDRIKGHISQNSSRLPIGTIENLRNRIKGYFELGKEISLDEALNDLEKRAQEQNLKNTSSTKVEEDKPETKIKEKKHSIKNKIHKRRNKK